MTNPAPKSATSSAPKRNLLQVKPGSYVYLPPRLINRQRGAARIWLQPGDVIDATDPFITHCLVGQMDKVRPAPQGTLEKGDVRHPLVEAYRRELSAKNAPKPPNPKKVEAVAAAKAEGLIPAAGIPAPDVDPAPAASDADPGDEQAGTDPTDPSVAPPKGARKK